MSSDQKIQAIIFDCFGVITQGTWKAFMESLPPTADTKRASDLNRAYDARMISLQEFLDGVKQATGREPQQVEELLAEDIVKNIKLLEYIKQLREQGYKIGMLSNIATNWVREQLLTPKEAALFDDMVFSFEVGMAKPDPRIFQLVCDRLQVAPEQAVLIDDIDYYCAAAEGIGMRAIVYKDFAQTQRELRKLLEN
jgi:epoxide hydrolase-like predicted phosphatase